MKEREQSNGTFEKATGKHKSYSRIAQVRLSSPWEDQHTQAQARKSDDRPAWARRTTPPMWDSDDDSWEYVTKKKPSVKKAVLYVGNLDPETTEDRLQEFISRRAAKVQIKKPNIFNCKMFLKEKDGEKTCGARITVDAESQQQLKVGQFWPGRVYARKWYFQEAVRQTEDQERDVDEVAREGETTPETGNSCSAPVEETLQA